MPVVLTYCKLTGILLHSLTNIWEQKTLAGWVACCVLPPPGFAPHWHDLQIVCGKGDSNLSDLRVPHHLQTSEVSPHYYCCCLYHWCYRLYCSNSKLKFPAHLSCSKQPNNTVNHSSNQPFRSRYHIPIRDLYFLILTPNWDTFGMAMEREKWWFIWLYHFGVYIANIHTFTGCASCCCTILFGRYLVS